MTALVQSDTATGNNFYFVICFSVGGLEFYNFTNAYI